MNRSLESDIDELIEQSNDIAHHVKLENWDQVEQLTDVRQLLLENFFRTPISVSDAKPVHDMIRNILDIDKSLIRTIENEKSKTFKMFANLKSNFKAQSTYKNIAALKLC